uniref:Uncharacterized protein n=1 Tax=Rhizophora mucronata TaxID=61149 RepID=A0A2P2PNT2_RHIMU
MRKILESDGFLG